jgi:three-Cys-motif partner protein
LDSGVKKRLGKNIRISMDDNEDFFDSQTPSSLIKAMIVAKYFPSYCRIIGNKAKWKAARYVDLFAGPGIYKDGNHSTPLLLGRAIADDQVLRNRVQWKFNDNKYMAELQSNFNEEFPEGTFQYAPRFCDKTVGEDEAIDRWLNMPHGPLNEYPTLLFFDPFGYKTINTIVLSKFLGGWANELFLFVNIKRINAAIKNKKFDDLMLSLFPTTIDQLRVQTVYKAGNPYQRLGLIINNLGDEFKKQLTGTVFCCGFKFQEEDSDSTSHYLLHVCKHSSGYGLIKSVYSAFDNIGAVLEKEGTYTFDAKLRHPIDRGSIPFSDQNIQLLREAIQRDFNGRPPIDAKSLYDKHHTSNLWNGKHYVTTLRQMVVDGDIESKYTDNIEHKESVYLIRECILTFKK